jgi:hypothetical protein
LESRILGKKEESSLKTFLTEDKQKFKKELIEELENNIKSSNLRAKFHLWFIFNRLI